MTDEYTRLLDVYLPIGAAVFALVAVLVLFAVLRFRTPPREFPRGREDSRSEYV